jgi:hypothetical protein
MDSFSDRRLVENEVIFRRLNSGVKDFVLNDDTDHHYTHKLLGFYCECSNIDCRERIRITAEEYDSQHKNSNQFIVKISHSMPEIEDVVEQNSKYEVVEKKFVPVVPKGVDPKNYFME